MRRLSAPVLGTQLAGMRRNPGRTLMSGLSVLLAAFVVFATVLAHEITTRTFLDSFSDTPEATSLVIESSDAKGIGPAEPARLRALPGVAEAVGRTNGTLTLAGSTDRRLELVAEPGTGPLARHRLSSGEYPDRDNELVLGSVTAEQLSVSPGSRLRLRRGGGENGSEPELVTVTITGLVDSAATGEAYAPDQVIRRLLALDGFERVDVRADSTTSAADLQQSVRAVLPGVDSGTVTLRLGDEVRRREAKDAVRQFDVVFALIGMFLLVAVIAAGLVATSTFRIVFGQRLRQLALLRTIGTESGQLGRALAIEGALTGLLAGLGGVIAAVGVVRAARAVASATGKPLAGAGFPVLAATLTVVGAVLITLGSVIAPALSAADVSPLHALRSADTSSARPEIGSLRWSIGLVLVLAAALAAGTVVTSLPVAGEEYKALESNLLKIVMSGALAFAALIALGPVLLRGLLVITGRPLRRIGLTAALAAEDLRNAPRRAAAVSVVVALGVALIAGTVVATASVRTYVDSGLAVQAPADFDVSRSGTPFSPAVVERLSTEPTLTDVTFHRTVAVVVSGTSSDVTHNATDLDLAGLPKLKALSPAAGSVTGLQADEAVLSDAAAYELRLTVGDRLTLQRGRSSRSFTVRAVLSGNAPTGSDFILTTAALDGLKAPVTRSGVFANAADPAGAGRSAAEKALRTIVGSQPGTDLNVLVDAGDGIDTAVSKLFAAALGLIGLTVLIAVVGVGTTMSLTVMERTREFGLLRALGLGRAGLRAMIGIESGLYGLIGATTGLLLGVPYAWLTILALNLNAPLQIPIGQLLIVIGVLTAVTVVAGLLPTRRAVRVSPIAALRTGG
jgi:putative ABC transport system permease protein